MQPSPHLRIVVDNVAHQEATSRTNTARCEAGQPAFAGAELLRRAWAIAGRFVAVAVFAIGVLWRLPIVMAVSLYRLFIGTILFLMGLVVLATLALGPAKAILQAITG